MNITLSEALKLNIDNKFQVETLLKTKEEVDKINKFYPCECFCEVHKNSNDGYYLDHTDIFLINDVCKIRINYSSYTKKYSIYYNSNFNNILDHNKISEVRKKFKEPQKIGVLTTKKIENWIKHEQNVYLALAKEDERLTNNVENFLKTLIGEDVKWYNNNKSGEIVRNGVRYSFSIDKGYVSQKVELHYGVENTLESFRLLSDNKINRVSKLERITK